MTPWESAQRKNWGLPWSGPWGGGGVAIPRPSFRLGDRSHLGPIRGFGDPTFTRTSNCMVQDHEDLWWTMPANCALRKGARFVDHGDSVDYGMGANGIEAFDTDADGVALDPQPVWEHQPPATNEQIRSNDLADVEWTASNVTVGDQDEAGIDGAPDSACTLTASAANGTVIANATTEASGEHATRWFIKRAAGTGTVELTLDNGSTWQDITSSITSLFTSIAVDQAALANPQIGIRIVTDTDAVIVGNTELYFSTSKDIADSLNPIFTAAAAVSTTTPAHKYQLSGNVDATELMLVVKGWVPGISAADHVVNQGVVGIRDNNIFSILYINTNGRFFSYDGTSFSVKDPFFVAANEYNIFVRASAINGKFRVGYRNVTGAGSVQWGTELNFDGEYLSVGDFIHFFYQNAYPQTIRDILIWTEDHGEAFFEANY